MPTPDRSPQQIVEEQEPCATATNGSGIRCRCPYPCANWFLRAASYKAEDPAWPRPCNGDNHGECPKHPEVNIPAQGS